MTDELVSNCIRPIIVIGSAQEYGTERNVFPVGERIKAIKAVYGNAVICFALNDLSSEDDITPEWGKYLLKAVTSVYGKEPEYMIYGNDESRTNWFSNEDQLERFDKTQVRLAKPYLYKNNISNELYNLKMELKCKIEEEISNIDKIIESIDTKNRI